MPPVRKPLILDDDDEPMAVSGAWILGSDDLLGQKSDGFVPFRKGSGLEIVECTMDPRDIDVDVGVILGRGACGLVSRGVHKPSGTPLAIKAVQVDDRTKRDQMVNDIRALLANQDCDYLVQLFAAYFHNQSGRVHIALELMDLGSLENIIIRSRTRTLAEPIVRVIIYQVLKGLSFLHGRKYIHRDLKPGNILINSKGQVKLSDFGISKTLDKTYCATFVGTAIYMSPERAIGQEYSYGADIWSLGCVLYELTTGALPFPKGASFPVLFDFLCNQPEPRLPPSFSQELCDIVSLCLQRDPSKRPSAVDLESHPFFRDVHVDGPKFSQWLQEIIPTRCG